MTSWHSTVIKNGAKSERAIGRWRIRSRSVRGFETWSGLVNAFILCNAPLV